MNSSSTKEKENHLPEDTGLIYSPHLKNNNKKKVPEKAINTKHARAL